MFCSYLNVSSQRVKRSLLWTAHTIASIYIELAPSPSNFAPRFNSNIRKREIPKIFFWNLLIRSINLILDFSFMTINDNDNFSTISLNFKKWNRECLDLSIIWSNLVDLDGHSVVSYLHFKEDGTRLLVRCWEGNGLKLKRIREIKRGVASGQA